MASETPFSTNCPAPDDAQALDGDGVSVGHPCTMAQTRLRTIPANSVMVPIMKLRPTRAALVAMVFIVGLSGCGDGSGRPSASTDGARNRPRVVVTYSILGAVVRDIVGDAADVKVLMANGTDPHEWRPSARDVEAMRMADLVVDNGLGLEGNLLDPLKDAAANGARVFTVADHITIRKVKAGEGAAPDDPDQAPGADDPHLWMDPLTMRQWVAPLVPVLREVGIDASTRAGAVEKELEALNAEVAAILNAVPAPRRKLVTGHESLGYLAQRYGYRLVGAVVPALSSQAEPSAGQLADLIAKIKQAGVPAIFTEVGTSASTVKAIADDSGTKVVALAMHNLPADGSYRTFMLDIANVIASSLGAET